MSTIKVNEMTPEQRVNLARECLVGTDYAMYKKPTTIQEYRDVIGPLQSRMYALVLGDQSLGVSVPPRKMGLR